MSRWIDADALPRHGQRGGLVHWKDIEKAPSIDLVRCKECENHKVIPFGENACFYWCFFSRSPVDADGFCSYGERRESE
jgi:hypothetical protein